MIRIQELKGTIHEIGEEQTVGKNNLRKRTVVIKTYDLKPDYFSLEAMGDELNDKLKTLERLNPIRAEFGLFGNQWTNREGVTKYFNNAKLFDISLDGSNEVVQKAKQVEAAIDLVAGTENAYATKQNKEDLPF